MSDRSSAPTTRLTSYQLRLFFLLSVANFFEGFEYVALGQVLPSLRAEFALSESQAGTMVGVIGLSALCAYGIIRQADLIGRRRVLSLTIAGYTISCLLAALAADVYQFTLAQLAARAFLLGEFAVSMIYLAEEFPADKRGLAVGMMQGINSFGAIACAGLVPPLLKTAWGYRTVYVVGSVPLLLLIWLRRNVRETERFQRVQELGAPDKHLLAIFRTPYRGRVFLLAAVWGLSLVCTYLSITYWKEFAVQERGLSDEQVSHALMIAALGSLPLVFASGKMLEVLGRRWSALLVLSCASISTLLSYNAHVFWALTLGLTGAIFSASAVSPVLNSFTVELFPTALRASGYAWSNSLLGKIGYVVGPLAVGFSAERWGYGPSLSLVSLCPLLALALVMSHLPETRGRELEETSAL